MYIYIYILTVKEYGNQLFISNAHLEQLLFNTELPTQIFKLEIQKMKTTIMYFITTINLL